MGHFNEVTTSSIAQGALGNNLKEVAGVELEWHQPSCSRAGFSGNTFSSPDGTEDNRFAVDKYRFPWS
jgi:hypothetical protein